MHAQVALPVQNTDELVQPAEMRLATPAAEFGTRRVPTRAEPIEISSEQLPITPNLDSLEVSSVLAPNHTEEIHSIAESLPVMQRQDEVVMKPEPLAAPDTYVERGDTKVAEAVLTSITPAPEIEVYEPEENYEEGFVAEPLEIEAEPEPLLEVVSEPIFEAPNTGEPKVLTLNSDPPLAQPNEIREIELAIEEAETPPLPSLLEEFITFVADTDHEQDSLEERLEILIENLEIETGVEEASETIETFTLSVSEIKNTIETTEEVTGEQIKAVVMATIELLKVLSIEPQPENIKRIIVLALGEEFVLAHQAFISDFLVNELGTHERKRWLTLSNWTDQATDHPTLLGRIALQLGLSLGAA